MFIPWERRHGRLATRHRQLPPRLLVTDRRSEEDAVESSLTTLDYLRGGV